MIDADSLTRDVFLEELRERLDALRMMEVDVPSRVDSTIMAIIAVPEDPFALDHFRLAAAHLLDGLEPEMAKEEGAADLLVDRMCALPDNLRLALRVAMERNEQPV
jgi:hypothetical protein